VGRALDASRCGKRQHDEPLSAIVGDSERAARMNPVVLALVCGAGFGTLPVALMLPMTFPDKRAALMGELLVGRARENGEIDVLGKIKVP
jgi:hypothetical protein